jgi:arylsulfatase A-like enzyme
MNGIFISKGKGIKQDMELDSARIIDVAPTILHVMGSAVPEDMDGRVLKEIFEPNSTLATRDVRYEKVVERKDMSEFIMSKDDQEKVEARLRQLGYLT